MIAEGFAHTRSKKRYMLTMLVFALISEIPYNLMMGGELIGPFHQNVMFTFLIAMALMTLIERVMLLNRGRAVKLLLVGMICLCGVVLGTAMFVDYSGFGVLTVLVFYIAKLMPNKYMTFAIQFFGLWVINWTFLGGEVIILSNGAELPKQGLAVLSLVFILLYNGKKSLSGKADKAFKYFSYAFYPVHILVLSLVTLYL